jgi:toxin ParE1/3/4
MKRHRVVISPDAEQHLSDLQEYIASKTSVRIARKFLRRLTAEIYSLGPVPYRGQSRDGLVSTLRTIGFARSVSIVFEVLKDDRRVNIVAVLYRGRSPSEAYRYENKDETFDEL